MLTLRSRSTVGAWSVAKGGKQSVCGAANEPSQNAEAAVRPQRSVKAICPGARASSGLAPVLRSKRSTLAIRAVRTDLCEIMVVSGLGPENFPKIAR